VRLLYMQRFANLFTLLACPLLQAYWGEPEAGWLSMFTHQVGLQEGAGAGHAVSRSRCGPLCLLALRLLHQHSGCCSRTRMQVGDVAIVHTHGPKPELAL